MPDPYFDIQDEIDRILSAGQSRTKKAKFFQGDFIKNLVDNVDTKRGTAAGVNNVKSFGVLANSGHEMGLATAYQMASGNLERALADGDTEGVAFWSSALNAVGTGLQDYASSSGSGGGSPYDSAMALAQIYDTAVNLGTMKASAADKAMQAALDQAKLTQNATYVPGYEPYGLVSGMLSSPWGGIGEAGKYTKVDVPDADSITQAAEDGFNQALAALMGSFPGSGGGGTGSGGGGSTASAVNAANSLGTGATEMPPMDFGGLGGSITSMVSSFLGNAGSNEPAPEPRRGAFDPGAVDWASAERPFWDTRDPNELSPEGWPSVGSSPQLGPHAKVIGTSPLDPIQRLLQRWNLR